MNTDLELALEEAKVFTNESLTLLREAVAENNPLDVRTTLLEHFKINGSSIAQVKELMELMGTRRIDIERFLIEATESEQGIDSWLLTEVRVDYNHMARLLKEDELLEQLTKGIAISCILYPSVLNNLGESGEVEKHTETTRYIYSVFSDFCGYIEEPDNFFIELTPEEMKDLINEDVGDRNNIVFRLNGMTYRATECGDYLTVRDYHSLVKSQLEESTKAVAAIREGKGSCGKNLKFSQITNRHRELTYNLLQVVYLNEYLVSFIDTKEDE